MLLMAIKGDMSPGEFIGSSLRPWWINHHVLSFILLLAMHVHISNNQDSLSAWQSWFSEDRQCAYTTNDGGKWRLMHLFVHLAKLPDKWWCKQFPLSLIVRFWYSIHPASALMKEVPFMATLHSTLRGSICRSLYSHACLVILSSPHALDSWQEG
jgi:hypothetical protein